MTYRPEDAHLSPDAKKPKKLSKKSYEVLDAHLAHYGQNRAAAWLSAYPKAKASSAYRSMTALLKHPDAQAYLRERIDEVLSNTSLKDLRSHVTARIAVLLADPTTKACDVARLSAALVSLVGWSQQTLTLDVPELRVVVSDESEVTPDSGSIE